MMKKRICLALCLILLAVPFCALGAARLPAERGVVTDDADVLSAELVSGIEEYASEVEDETGLELHVALVHFLDGLDAQTYANALFEKWELGDSDILLLGAAGEDSFATAMGEEAKSLLGEKNAENLLFTSSSFSTQFRAQAYDQAFRSYFSGFNSLLKKQTGAEISLNNLGISDSRTVPSPTVSPKEYSSQLWEEVMEAVRDSSEDYQVYHETRRSSENGLSAGGWIVLVVLIAIVFSQSGPVRRRRRSGERRGCGCSPFGWLMSLFGVNALMNAFRRKR